MANQANNSVSFLAVLRKFMNPRASLKHTPAPEMNKPLTNSAATVTNIPTDTVDIGHLDESLFGVGANPITAITAASVALFAFLGALIDLSKEKTKSISKKTAAGVALTRLAVGAAFLGVVIGAAAAGAAALYLLVIYNAISFFYNLGRTIQNAVQWAAEADPEKSQIYKKNACSMHGALWSH